VRFEVRNDFPATQNFKLDTVVLLRLSVVSYYLAIIYLPFLIVRPAHAKAPFPSTPAGGVLLIDWNLTRKSM
jgi:hypothetical protein